MKKTIFIDEIGYSQCNRIQKILGEIHGVVGVNISLEDKSALIEYIGNIKDELVKDRLHNMGYNVVKILNE